MAEILSFKVGDEIALANILWKVPPGRPKNADVRSREHLLPDEVKALMKAAGSMTRQQNTP